MSYSSNASSSWRMEVMEFICLPMEISRSWERALLQPACSANTRHPCLLPLINGGVVSWSLHRTFLVRDPPTQSPLLLVEDTTAFFLRLSEVPRPLMPTDPRQTSSSHQDELLRAPTGPFASSSRVKKQLGGSLLL